MKKFVVCFRTVMYLLALTLGFQSCDKDDDPVTNDKGQVLAVIYDNAEQNENWGEDTKTAPKTVWLQDDAIGVFCVEPGKSLGKVNFASNKKYVYNNGKFEAASEADKIWISREGTFKFYAYYPYSTSKTGVDVDGRALEFTVASDQTSDANRTNSDILAGKSTIVDNATGEVDMDFYHMMSDVRFSWTRSDANANEYVNALFGTTAVINLDALTSVQKSGQNPGTGIRMNIKNAYNATTGSTEFQAFVPPVAISDGQDLFVPYDAGNKPLAAIKAKLSGTTQTLERGKTYDLAGDMYTITADVRRNGDLANANCDSYDGCVITTGGGDAGTLKKFVGRYLSGRECQVGAEMGKGLPLGTQFIGWFEYDAKANTWTKIEGAGETYKFTVNKNRRIQARYENYVYTPWQITWSSPVANGGTTPTVNIGATDASSRNISLRATRIVTLDGENVTDPALTTRENDRITLKVQESEYVPTGNKDRFNEPAWVYTESSKTIKSTPNSDEVSGATVARKLVAHVVIDGQDMYTTENGKGALDNPIDHSKVAQATYLLTVNQAKGTVSYGDKDDSKWSVLIENAAAINSKMDAKGTVNGAEKGTFDAYIYRPRKVSGVVVDIETIAQADIKSAFSSNADSHWGISSVAKTRTFPAAQFGHDFANKQGAAFSVTTKNNKTESERSQTITISSTTSGTVTGKTPVKQNAGVKTNKTWTDYVITLTGNPTTLQVIASSGAANTSQITTSATRDMNYDWNNITADKGTDKQTGSPTLSITQGSNFATINGSTSGSRVSVQKNYDASTLGTPTSDRNVVVTATMPNTENGHSASTKTVTITQKGGTVTEERGNGSGQAISTKNTIGADGGSTGYNITNPKRTVTVKLDGSTVLDTYTETGVLTSVMSSSGMFTSNTSSVSAGANKGKETDDYTNWTPGSVTISGGTIPVGGGSSSVSITVPSRTKTHRYDTSTRTATLTGTWTFSNSTGGSDGDGVTVTATCTVSQNGSTATINTEKQYYSIKSVTASGAASYSGGTSSSGTVSFGDNHGTPVDRSASWSGGSVSLSNSSFGRTGGTASISYDSPSRSTWKEYNSSSRSTTVTATFSYSGESDKTASDNISQSGSTVEVSGSRDTEYAGAPTLSTTASWASVSGSTLTVRDGTSTYKDYWIGNGSLSISGSPIAAKGGTATASPTKPNCGWTEYYNSVNRNSSVSASWTEGNITRSASYSQTANSSSTGITGSGTATTGNVSWPSWCPGGRAGENTGSSRSGPVSVTFTYEGESSSATATVSQSGASITYGNYRITVSPTSMTWNGDKVNKQSYTVTGYRTKYVNGVSKGEEICTVSDISVSCTGDFSGNSSSIWPDGTNEDSSDKTGTATVTATPSGGTSCTATISLKQLVRDWTVTD
ncbi:hypothetical protein DWZ28_18080 [Parabacteroides merdae]|uniref:fimbrillin family protein n=1 Tax=Parabacteroides merdae TaxID=46503 RepID=UPI000F0043A0|nr:fimbrillin family protein [Parabacteroides merdae]RHN13323.1 hypothetical protein DWZ28_18080 [Parabacteroides merdae]